MAVHAYSTPGSAPAPLTTRARLEAAVEAAIAALDAIDGDPDLDAGCEDEGADTDSEPSLGSLEGGSGGTRWTAHYRPRDVLDGEVDRQPVEAF